MFVDFFLEERSAEAALKKLIPRILHPDRPGCRFHVHSGKYDLLKKLPQRLCAFKKMGLGAQHKVVVLIDEDRQDCRLLKQQLEQAASCAGLRTLSAATSAQPISVLNRIAIEELEAWFLGDIDAVVTAYPRLPNALARRLRNVNPDAIHGGTWEHLESQLKKSGYYSGGMPKIEVARRVSEYMDPSRNRSGSFRAFADGLRRLVSS